jgi:hypothetical protein
MRRLSSVKVSLDVGSPVGILVPVALMPSRFGPADSEGGDAHE